MQSYSPHPADEPPASAEASAPTSHPTSTDVADETLSANVTRDSDLPADRHPATDAEPTDLDNQVTDTERTDLHNPATGAEPTDLDNPATRETVTDDEAAPDTAETTFVGFEDGDDDQMFSALEDAEPALAGADTAAAPDGMENVDDALENLDDALRDLADTPVVTGPATSALGPAEATDREENSQGGTSLVDEMAAPSDDQIGPAVTAPDVEVAGDTEAAALPGGEPAATPEAPALSPEHLAAVAAVEGAVDRVEEALVEAAPPADAATHPPAAEVIKVAQQRPGEVTQSRIAVWDDSVIDDYRSRLFQIQARFVDDPYGSVDEARSVVVEAIRGLAGALLNAQAQFDPHRLSDSPDTEAMRIAIRQYRDFLDRVLSL